MNLSVVIPVYNEVGNVKEIIRRVQAQNLANEIVVVDDGSTDGTRDILKELVGRDKLRVILHERNQGKGAAVVTGLHAARGDILLIQDADLEYDPRDYPHPLQPIEEQIADVVYGSRFLGGPRRVAMFWHMIANKLLTAMTNILYDTILTDMETGYKVFRREVNFKIKGTFYDITTTARYTPPVTVCFAGSFTSSDWILHFENGLWVKLPNRQLLPAGDPPYSTICGDTDTLSPFVVATDQNQPPTADVGPDQIVVATGLTVGLVTLTGTGKDPDGDLQ